MRLPRLNTLLLVATLCAAAHARPVGIWSEADLWDKADVVVLATPTQSADAKDRADLGAAGRETWVNVDTTFAIQAVLKGEAAKAVTVRHARYADKEIPVPNGPVFVEFNPDRKQQFLIFLKRTADGRYEPLTGQLDPYMSFRLVQPYSAIFDRKP